MKVALQRGSCLAVFGLQLNLFENREDQVSNVSRKSDLIDLKNIRFYNPVESIRARLDIRLAVGFSDKFRGKPSVN